VTPYDRWKTTDRLAEAPDPLEGKPRGFCVYCDNMIGSDHYGMFHINPRPSDCQASQDLTEDQNRIRYAAQRLEESKLWNKIEKEGGERC
jgi:hypothetical protein